MTGFVVEIGLFSSLLTKSTFGLNKVRMDLDIP